MPPSANDAAIGPCYVAENDMRNFRIAADWRFLGGLDDGDSNKLFKEYFEFGKFKKLSVQDWTEKDKEGSMPPKIVNQRGFFAKVPKGAQ